MVTVPEATTKVIKRSRYLSEALSKDIINISSLARYIRPEIESMLIKKVSLSSVIMALKRMKGQVLPDTPYQEIFKHKPEITIKTGLSLLISRDPVPMKFPFESKTENTEGFVALGKKEDMPDYEDDYSKLFYPVSSISIVLPEEAVETAGIYYFFIKSIAWERINILQVFSSPSEIRLVVAEADMQRAVEILSSLFEKVS